MIYEADGAMAGRRWSKQPVERVFTTCDEIGFFEGESIEGGDLML